jgi:hypothetical protein
LVAQDGLGPAGHDGRQLASQRRERRVPDGIDAAMKAMQPPRADAMVDGPQAQPKGGKLASRDHAALVSSYRGDRPISRQT